MSRMTDIYGRHVEFQARWVVLKHNDDSDNGEGAWSYIGDYYEIEDAQLVVEIQRKLSPDSIYGIVRFVSI